MIKKFTAQTVPLIKQMGETHVNLYTEYPGGYPGGLDSFARHRTSSPTTLFEHKFINGGDDESRKDPHIWDESISGAGSSVHSVDRSAITLSVTNGTVIRQTFVRFGYQAGKSQVIQLTGVLGSGGSGVDARIGAFDGSNGVYFQSLSGITYATIEKNGVAERS